MTQTSIGPSSASARSAAASTCTGSATSVGIASRAPAGRGDLAARALEPVLAAGEQRDPVAAGAEGAGRGPPHARAGAGDDNGAHADQLPRRGPSYAGASAR